MGEYAEIELNRQMGLGTHNNPGYKPKTRAKAICDICGKHVEATEGFKHHMKAKHGESKQLSPQLMKIADDLNDNHKINKNSGEYLLIHSDFSVSIEGEK